MNIYVRETAAALAARGWAIDIFTRLHASAANCIDPTPGIGLFHVPAGPIDARKDDLHQWLAPFVAGVLETRPRTGGARVVPTARIAPS